jgi:cleavage and polyadenylation specificity factor subunit 4
LENAEMAKDIRLDTNENCDRKELSSIDGETGIADHDDEEEDGAGTSPDSSDEDEVDDAYEEQFNEPEDDAAA